MHSLKVLARARRSLRQLGSFPHQRSLSAQPHYASHDDVQDQVLVDGRASSRTAILNRPSALNSLTTSMVARLKRLYESWEENPNVGFVSMKGSGKAFCSGGDVVTLYHLLTEDLLRGLWPLPLCAMGWPRTRTAFPSYLSHWVCASVMDGGCTMPKLREGLATVT
ncbi:hypothetical protein NL676_034279 [Syzygium grande]|nr:hypothetical protein NL676_034279 [Syzygium grande]